MAAEHNGGLVGDVLPETCCVLEAPVGTQLGMQLAERAARPQSGSGSAYAGRNLCIVVARASHKAPMRTALERAGVGCATVTTPLELGLSVLKTPAAQEATGRTARVVTPFEENLVNEDLKTLGLQTKRLREMLKFLHRGLWDLADRDPEWLVTGEERLVLQSERDTLKRLDAMLPCEVANVACGYLDEHGVSGHGYAHILVDGWTSLSFASQRLVALLAGKSLTAGCYQDDPGVEGEPHPNRDGAQDLLAQRPDAEHVLVDPTPQTTSIATPVWDDPDAEFSGLASLVASRLAQGMPASDIAVITPNRVWSHRLQSVFEAHGIHTALAEAKPLHGDTRVMERCGSQRAFALLGLAANPLDPLAWRLWTGCGDWLLNSAPWHELVERARTSGRTPVEELLSFTDSPDVEEPLAGGERLVYAVKEAREALASLDGLSGIELIGAACNICDIPVDALLDVLGNETDGNARVIVNRLRSAVVDPGFCAHDSNDVRIGFAEAFLGERTALTILCGLVDGFIPSAACFNDRTAPDTKARLMELEHASFKRALGIARDRLVLSRFDHEWLEAAEPARMEVKRIRAEAGGRMATIRPSSFLLSDPLTA